MPTLLGRGPAAYIWPDHADTVYIGHSPRIHMDGLLTLTLLHKICSNIWHDFS